MAGMLDGKVVVISGVGPALGTTLARRCAAEGADLVLAARTLERLDDVAKQITDTGGAAVAVGTDITDDDAGGQPRRRPLKAYGKVDVLINNAFRVPSMKPLAGTTFQHIRDAIELSVLGALRLIQGFTPGAGRGRTGRSSTSTRWWSGTRRPNTAPTRWRSPRCWRCRSRWPPNSASRAFASIPLLPGYIWGDTLQGYFEHQAGKYGTTVDEIYQATAANSDLKRLPTEDEVASAILFMASDLSSGITGQTLDVNCGEYHT